jgi:SSS family solute:Na+ symporter
MALGIICLALLVSLALAVLARRRRGVAGFEQWAIAGRGFGTIFVFLLLAGEIYTAFTFLGASGFIYSHGAPAYYILAYPTRAYTISYLIRPPIWRYAKQNGVVTQAQYFSHQFGSPALGLIVTLIGVVASVPYLVLQFKGLGIIIQICSGGTIPLALAVAFGGATVALYVLISGMQGSAWMSAFKDILVLAVIVFLGIYLPLHYYGSYGAMFRAIDAARPAFLTLRREGFGPVWYDSTVALTALGFFLFPHSFTAIFTAREEDVFRRNAALLPFYQLILLFAFFVGFAAVLQVEGLEGPKSDFALFALSIKTFPDWAIGIIGAGGALAAIVPGAVILTSIAALIAKGAGSRLPTASDQTVARTAKLLVPVITVVGVYFALYGGRTIVTLLLAGYALVTQLLWALIAGLTTRRCVTPHGLIAGILAGVGTVALNAVWPIRMADMIEGLPNSLNELNIGILALVINFFVVILVSGAMSVRSQQWLASER